MQRVTFLVPRGVREELVATLQELRLVHFEDAARMLSGQETFQRTPMSAESADSKLKQLELIENLFTEFAAEKLGFMQSLVNMPLRVSEAELRDVVAGLDIEPLYAECRGISEKYRENERTIEQGESEIAALDFFSRLPFKLAQVHALRRTGVWIGSLSARDLDQFQADPWVGEHLAVEELFRQKRTVYVCVIAYHADASEAASVLKRYDFAEKDLPPPGVSARERTSELLGKVEALRRECDLHRRRVAELAKQYRRAVAILRGHWLAEQARIQALNSGATAGRIAVFSGYVRESDTGELEKELARAHPGTSLVLQSPTPEEEVPVSLSSGRIIKPMRFLVDMFGRPDYFSFDPTPYLSLSFLVFFGFCFGDVVYGLMLCALAGYLAWKARHYEGLNNLCMLFCYCGIATIIVGLLTGAWASDLWDPKYLGEGNPLQWLKEHTAIVDPLSKPILLLLVALGLGVVNQLYAVVLKGYGLLRRGDVWGAVFDAGLWLVMLPAFLVVFGSLFFDVPGGLFRTAVVLGALAGMGLVLTQGRKESGLLAKAITGVVSIYGILGSYGCISFLGDMLSYSRLLALGLTTSIIGLSFNIMAGLLREVPWVGALLFVLTLVAGHAFNFLVSILGAFVHPARLIFLEFFMRFYESSGVRFRPLSRDSERILVTNT